MDAWRQVVEHQDRKDVANVVEDINVEDAESSPNHERAQTTE